MPVRAVIDTSALVPPMMRRRLQVLAASGTFVAIWSPWIIAELNRVLVWRSIKDRTSNDLSLPNEWRCSDAAQQMMNIMLPTFEVVTPLPPYPPAWPTLRDPADYPIWAAAVAGGAHYVISENTRDYPPRGEGGRHVHEGIEYLGAYAFLDRLAADQERDHRPEG